MQITVPAYMPFLFVVCFVSRLFVCVLLDMFESAAVVREYHYPFSLPRSSRFHSHPSVGALYIKGEHGRAQLHKYTRTSPGGEACEFFMRLT